MPRKKQTNRPPSRPVTARKMPLAGRTANTATLQAQLTVLGTPSIHRYLEGPWQMHLAFAYHLVRELNPNVFVELGVYKGESYFAFCQSVQENNLVTQCYGVDTWRGDPHSGFYCAEIGEEVADYNRRYAHFSHLLARTFKEAVEQFEDQSIDLLHIDGAHRYEDVKEDFEMWRSKLSENGIVLFHDVMEREHEFGVYRLWEEIARPRASFLFEFGHGLGVWKGAPLTNNDAPFLRRLFLANSHERQIIDHHYASIAEEVELAGKTAPSFLKNRIAPTYLQVFGSRHGASSEEYSRTIEILAGQWCRPRIDLPWGVGDGSVPLRLDPVDRVGMVDLAAITLRSATGEILWRANTESGLDELTIRGTASRLPHARSLRLLAYGDDPQIYLPHLKQELFQDPLDLEIVLRFDSAAQSTESAVSGWNESLVSARPTSFPDAETSSSETFSPSPPSSDQITMMVYSAEESGYTEERATQVTYTAKRWSHLDIALQLGLGTQPLRLDPLTTIGLIDVAAVTIRSAINDEVLWRAVGGAGLGALQVSGSAVRIPHPDLARFLSYGEGPQIYLPAFSSGKFDGPLRLEVWLKTEAGFNSIRKGITELAAISSRAFEQASKTRALLEQSTRDTSQKDAEIQSLRIELERTVNDRELQIENLRTSLNVRTSETGSQQEHIQNLEAIRSEQELALKAHQSEIGSQRDHINNLEGIRTQLESEVAPLRQSAVEMRLKLNNAKKQLKDQKSELNEIKDATLWKACKLLWKLRRHFSKRARGSSEGELYQDSDSGRYDFWLEHPSGPSIAGRGTIFSGWVVGPSRKTIYGLRAVANGQIFPGQYGFAREDVAIAYDGRVGAPHSGFRIEVTLPVGISEVLLEALNSKGDWEQFLSHPHDVKEERPEETKPGASTEAESRASHSGALTTISDGTEEEVFLGALDAPGPTTTNEIGLLSIAGWLYLKEDNVSMLSAHIGAGPTVSLTSSVPRVDVARALAHLPEATACGFQGYLPIGLDFSGPIILQIHARLESGTEILCFQREVVVQPVPLPVPLPVTSPPFTEKDGYEGWLTTNRLTPVLLKRMADDADQIATAGPLISVVVPIFNTPPDYLEALIDSLRTQLYPQWQLCLADDASIEPHVRSILEKAAAADSRVEFALRSSNGHIAQASNSALELAKGDYVGLLDHDDLLAPDALLHVAEAIRAQPAVDLLYTDEDKLSATGARYDPIFKGAFSPEMSITHNYVQHFAVIRTSLLRQVGGFREGFEGAQDLDLYLRVIERTEPARVRHLPFVCYHWRSHPASTASTAVQKRYVFESARRSIEEALARRCIRATAFLPVWAEQANCCLYQLRWLPELLRENPVTIVIPTKNRGDLLEKCVDSIMRTVDTAYVKLIVVDDFSDDGATKRYLKQLSSERDLDCEVIQPGSQMGEFNFSQLVNTGVAHATTPLVLLLNNDTEALRPGWLEEMVGWMSIKGVGAVGAKLLYPDGTVQHAGIIVGSHGGLAEHIFHRLPGDVIGLNFLSHAARNVTAVTAACMLTSKAFFNEMKGFDEMNFGMEYNDVDYCLRLGQAGKRTVFTPQATLLHHCGKSRGVGFRPHEHVNFLRRYPGIEDSYYSRSLDPEMPIKINPRHFVHAARIERLRVLEISHNLNLEGAPKVSFDRATYFASEGGYDITVASQSDGPLRGPYEEACISVTIVKPPVVELHENESEYAERLVAIGQLLGANSFDLIICNTLITFWGVLLAKLFALPVIWHIHESMALETFLKSVPALAGSIEGCFAYANRIAFEAESTRRIFNQYDTKNNFITMPGSVDVDAIDAFSQANSKEAVRRTHGIETRATIVTLIGTTCERKGQHIFIEAIKKLQSEGQGEIAQVHFVLLGGRESPYLKFLEWQLWQSGVKNTRIIEERAEVYDFYRLTDIFVCASFEESFPRVILEAMAFKLGIVSTNVFGIAEMIADGEEGYLVPPGDTYRLAERILRLIRNPAMRRQLGDKAHSKVTRLFNNRVQLRKRLDLTKEVVARHA